MSAHFGGPDPFCMMPFDTSPANGQLPPQELAKFHMFGRMISSNRGYKHG